LRNRFFLTIFSVLTAVTVVCVILHAYFLQNDRLEFIDQQVRETASSLVDSELGDLRKIDFEQVDKIISEELGESRIGKFFIIRNTKGDVIFQSAGALLLPIEDIPQTSKWVRIDDKGKFIRVLNLRLPRIPDRTLQVGVILDSNLVAPDYLSTSSLSFIAGVLFIGGVASLFLTSFLLSPIARLGKFLSQVSEEAKNLPQLTCVPDSMLKQATVRPKDEFHRMVVGLNALIEMVNKNYRFSRLWAYQMAHELKTPLSILNLEFEGIQKLGVLPDQHLQIVLTEAKKISETINSFLGWAELENSAQQKHLYINPLAQTVETICKRFSFAHPGRVELQIDSDASIAAAPPHLEQLISNLLGNALGYSPPPGKVVVKVSARSLSVIDQGPGIPNTVLERIGEPFNRGSDQTATSGGHGLGLAWVKSICRLYAWRLSFSSSPAGTTIEVAFEN
jgi:two-component system sensor histidine kinase QseC